MVSLGLYVTSLHEYSILFCLSETFEPGPTGGLHCHTETRGKKQEKRKKINPPSTTRASVVFRPQPSRVASFAPSPNTTVPQNILHLLFSYLFLPHIHHKAGYKHRIATVGDADLLGRLFFLLSFSFKSHPGNIAPWARRSSPLAGIMDPIPSTRCASTHQSHPDGILDCFQSIADSIYRSTGYL